ncbi:MAG: XDD3 family exosortase-dependent surface protein [Phormidium sp.]
MSKLKIRSLFLTSITATLCSLSVISKPAEAGTLYKDWNYAIDSFTDSITGNDVGGTKYELYGMAFKQTAEQIFVAINTNLPLAGTSSNYATDGHVGLGDLIFNFSGKNLSAASASKSLFGIRFVSNNDSGVGAKGIYDKVAAKSVAKDNGIALDSLGEYNAWVRQNGKTPSIGDLAANDPYFNQAVHVQNVMASGTKIGDINLLSNLSGLGLDFGHFGAKGSNTIALSFARSLLPDGDFIVNFAPECDNDIIALKGNLETVPEPVTKTVPEPSSSVGLLAFATFGGMLLKRTKQKKALNSSLV